MNPKRLSLFFILFGLSMLPGAVGAVDKDKNDVRFVGEYRLYRVLERLSGETSLDENIWAGKEAPSLEQKKSLTPFTSAKFQLGKNRFEIGDKGWFWDGASMDDRTTRTQALWDSINSIALMSASRVRVPNGKAVNIQVGSLQKLEYFEQRGDGFFELKRLDKPTGLDILMILTLEKDGRIRLNLEIVLRSVEKREPVPGVTLQVGRPILQSREHKAELLVRPGKEYGILLHAGDEGQGVLIFRLQLGIAKPAAGSDERTPAGSEKKNGDGKDKE